jgi:hypothetical protein
MTRMPSIVPLADRIRGTGKKSAQKSAEYLVAQREAFKLYPSVEDMAMYSDVEYAPSGASDVSIKTAKQLVHHFTNIRNALANELYSNQIFIGIEIIDELLFYILRDGSSCDPILEVLIRIRDSRLNRPGLIIFPLHSFGVLGTGPLRSWGGARLSIVNSASGYALFPQTNDLHRTLQQVETVSSALLVTQPLPRELIEHWYKSRSAYWLERNPLLVVRIHHMPGSYYSNEHLIVNRIQSVLGLLSLLAAIQPSKVNRASAFFSTSKMNNFETLDLRHYLALFGSKLASSELDGDCVPIHGSRTEISELAALSFELNPAYWRKSVKLGEDIRIQVESLYSAQLKQNLRGRPRNARERTIGRMFRSLQMFRRSYVPSADDWTGKVALSTAFEMLLTDHYGSVGPTLERRSRQLLRGKPGTRVMQHSVRDLYSARSQLVHGAALTTEADMASARRAYALCFLELGRLVPLMPLQTGTPVGDVVD